MLMETFDRLTRKEKYVWDVSDLTHDTPSKDMLTQRSLIQIYGHVRNIPAGGVLY